MYIKKFESFDSKSFWKIIDYNNHFNKLSSIDFDKKELDQILKLVDGVKSINRNIHCLFFNFKGTDPIKINQFGGLYRDIRICKKQDEWYFIKVYVDITRDLTIGDYYQCDQLDGLLDCLKYLSSI